MRIPKYRKHSVRDIGFCEFNKARQYFPGSYNSVESLSAYKAFLIDKVVAPDVAANVEAGLNILELAGAYLNFARQHYGDGSRGEYANIRHALKPLRDEYGTLPAEQFGPLKLKRLQTLLANRGLGRSYVNQTVSKIRRMFKWAVSEELIPATILHALETVPGLRANRSAAKESVKKVVVPWEHVELVLQELSAVTRAMVLLQWHTGARSGSICRATAEQFTRHGKLLHWHPRHKTEHLGKVVVLPVGPKCQAVLKPFLDGDPASPLFSPRSQRKNRRYNVFYKTSAYYRAVARAILRVNEAREKEGLPPIPHWSPHQLRHSKGTIVRRDYGAEAAQAVLGQASLQATELYTEPRFKLACKVALKTG